MTTATAARRLLRLFPGCNTKFDIYHHNNIIVLKMLKIVLKAAIYTFLHISTLKIVTDTIDTYIRDKRFMSGVHSAAMAEDAESLKLEMLDEDSLTRQPDEVSCQ